MVAALIGILFLPIVIGSAAALIAAVIGVFVPLVAKYTTFEVSGPTITFEPFDGTPRQVATSDVVLIADDPDNDRIVIHARTGTPMVLDCSGLTKQTRMEILRLLEQLERSQRERDRDFRMDDERDRLRAVASQPRQAQ